MVGRQHTSLPTGAGVTRCFLCVPATSEPSKELFSAARLMNTDRRNHVTVSIEKIGKPVAYIVRQVQLRHVLHETAVMHSIKCLAEV